MVPRRRIRARLGGSALYNGDQLSHLGDVVVVTVNARLGLMGFLPLDFSEGQAFRGASNAGMLDLVAALEWVRDNIAAFGGDPGNVTIFGQSGGGGKVNVLMAMPSARGLFHKAINMSGPVLSITEPAEATELARQVAERAGVAPGDTETWRELPLRELLDIQRNLSPSLGGAFGMEAGQGQAPMAFGWAPVLDGEFVTAHPFSTGAPADADGIPMLVGFASHDPSLLMAGSASFAALDEGTALDLAEANFGEAGASLLQKVMVEHPGEPVRLQYARVVNRYTFAAAALAMAEAKASRMRPCSSTSSPIRATSWTGCWARPTAWICPSRSTTLTVPCLPGPPSPGTGPPGTWLWPGLRSRGQGSRTTTAFRRGRPTTANADGW